MSNGNQAQRTYIILDRQRANKSHIISLGVSLLLFTILGFLFFAVSQIEDILIYGSVAIVLQLLFGVIATRSYHSSGMKARTKLAFLDPAKLNSKWELVETKLKNGEIERYFETVHSRLEKTEVEISDDINDLAWFVVTVWSIGSVILFTVIGSQHFLYSVAPPVLAAICLVVYIYSYKTNRIGYYSDEWDHLEFIVQSELASLRAILPEKSQTYVLWKIKKRNYVLYDLKIKFSLIGSENYEIVYSLGLPSTEKESFVVKIKKIEIYSPIILGPKYDSWKISEYSEMIGGFTITNTASNINLAERSSFVRIRDDRLQAAGVFKIILEQLHSR
ncbi:MAG: hypothetical protein ACTSUB_00990 [Candidatus Thorarchaeota archaeon]